jgi:cyclic pyranopterin phosphate synthase
MNSAKDSDRRTDDRPGDKEGSLSHIDSRGEARMVDVGGKASSHRVAIAVGRVRMSRDTANQIRSGTSTKGNVFGVARIAGIQAAKRTAELIPLCHPLPIDHIKVDLDLQEESVDIRAEVGVTGRTGVEMEALTAVSVAALTIYDMCKAVDPAMVIEEIRLDEKLGGKKGRYLHPDRQRSEEET